MDTNAKCRAVCAAVGKAPAFLEVLNEAETEQLEQLYDEAVGPMSEIADRFGQIEQRVRDRLGELKATDARVGEPTVPPAPGVSDKAAEESPGKPTK